MTFAELNWLGSVLVPLMTGVVLRSSILALLCGVLDYLLRKRPAEIRHAVWHGMLAALLIFPLLLIAVPPLEQPSLTLARAEAAISPVVPPVPTAVIVRPPNGVTVIASPPADAFPWKLSLAAAYSGVMLLLLARLVVCLRRLKAVVRRSEPVADMGLRELAHQAWLESGAFIRPCVRVSSEIAVPVALQSDANVFVLLPDCWQKWPLQKLRLALAHEMAHVRRNDPGTMLLAGLATCLYWFHPLSWFIKRRLAALSEYACDEHALAVSSDAQQYASTLADFARQVAVYRGRVLSPVNAVVHRSELESRIRRIFTASEIRRSGLNVMRCALMAALIPAVYFAAAARPQAQGRQPRWSVPSNDDQAAQMQAQLATSPNDLHLHVGLLFYYFNRRDRDNYIAQLLWIVQHEPGATLMGFPLSPQGGPLNTPDDYLRVAAAWEQALRDHADSSDVLYNAAMFFEHTDPERSLNLLRNAQRLDFSPKSIRYEAQIAFLYAQAVAAALHFPMISTKLDPDVASKLQLELEGSSDPALLSLAGADLVRNAVSQHDNPVLKQEGYLLLQRAIDLDPANPRWKEALQSAKYESVRQQNYSNMSQPAGAQRIGSGVMETNLIKKVDPVYPPLAIAARIQGTVDFTVTVGPDGHVENIQLVRGHPILVQAAKDAVLQWLYRPTLLNGKPVTVVTDVSVPFQLPQ